MQDIRRTQWRIMYLPSVAANVLRRDLHKREAVTYLGACTHFIQLDKSCKMAQQSAGAGMPYTGSLISLYPKQALDMKALIR